MGWEETSSRISGRFELTGWGMAAAEGMLWVHAACCRCAWGLGAAASLCPLLKPGFFPVE